jgi:hypothetical protein
MPMHWTRLGSVLLLLGLERVLRSSIADHQTQPKPTVRTWRDINPRVAMEMFLKVQERIPGARVHHSHKTNCMLFITNGCTIPISFYKQQQ